MKLTQKKSIPIMLTFLMTLLALQVTRAQTQWEAPASADNLNNPLKNDATAAESGKRTFRMLCVICHGAKGKGDGMGGAGLTPKPTDLTSTEVQSQTDGALFWKLTNGKPPMASYETALPENKRWELINYIRTLNK
ncbi:MULTISPECIES: c-type cytochrome [Flagellimonas]|uniref:Cytochrome c n=2 Tax=Flagellimonas TaxID=444459 RepID=A0A4S8RNP8_9FLAO|nr:MULTISPECIES: cytochrome c [Allomuricauda]NDV45224.1 c-type cytochrome [Allomuricauda sediminis]THV59462.1 cytochrome c [Allomuricauda alvinocaridis]